MESAPRLCSPASTSVPARIRTILYRYPSAVTVMTNRSPLRLTVHREMVRTVSPWAATEEPDAHSARKSWVPTNRAAASCMAARSSGAATRESLSKEEECPDASLSVKAMLPMAVATSIDALAVGVSFAFLSVNIGAAVSFIGVITFALSMVGVKVGSLFGAKYKSKAELAGGVILILMGLKILLEHLGVLG